MRAAIRRWQYRQRHAAAGVWFRLRRVLADAARAYRIADDEARWLLREGYAPERCGTEIEPAKTIVFVDEDRLARLTSREPIPVALGPAFLAASAVALVRFEDSPSTVRARPGPRSGSSQTP